MKTIHQLSRGENKYWARKAHDELSSVEILAWHAAADLSAFVEMNVEPENFYKVFPETHLVLWGLLDYFASIKQLPPLPLAHLMLMYDRSCAGLTPRGTDTKRPVKPVTDV